MVYQVILDKNVTAEMMKQLKKGQLIFDKEVKINIISHLDGKSKNEVGIEVHSLSPAALVKLFEAVGLKVIQMDRVTFGGMTKKDLEEIGENSVLKSWVFENAPQRFFDQLPNKDSVYDKISYKL